MCNDIVICEETEESVEIQGKNEYLIYDYLKNTPSLLIALISAIVAIVAFFAKSIMTVSIRNELAFWGFDYRYFDIGNESLFLNATILLLQSVLSSFCTICILETYESYLPFKKIQLMLGYRIKLYKKRMKEIKRKILSGKAKDEDRFKYDFYKEICVDYKKMKSDLDLKKDLLINIMPILFILFTADMLYAVLNAKNILLIVVIYVLIQIITIFVLIAIRRKNIINKKRIEKECLNEDFIQEQIITENLKIPPLTLLLSKGLRYVLKDYTIIAAIIVFFINSSSICISNGLTNTDPTATNKFYRITTLDNVEYAIVYQNDNQYFLEEIEIKDEKMPDGKNQKTLIIYADCQRIIISDDMSAELYECKAEKGYKHRNKEQSFSTLDFI